ncbi:hypothetical protein ACHAWF_018706 [Thalassiosira exigua]
MDPLVENVTDGVDGEVNDVVPCDGSDGSSGSCDVPMNGPPDSPPSCSMFDPSTVDRPISPDLVCDFPLDLKQDAEFDSLLAELPQMPSLLDSVVHVVDRPRVLGIGVGHDGASYACLTVRSASHTGSTPATMVDGGSNICLTNNLSHLLDVVNIAPIPVSVAIEDGSSTPGFVCTAKGMLPLRLDDGTIHYQPTYYCADAVETIISPQAILNSSDVFASWQQTGFKDGIAGLLRFSSHDGFHTMSVRLDHVDGLYYCPTDTFTVDSASTLIIENLDAERFDVPSQAIATMLPLRLTEMPLLAHPLAAAAARVTLFDRQVPTPTQAAASLILDEFSIGREAMEQIRHGLSRSGLPVLTREEFSQLAVDQFNNRWELPEDSELVTRRARYDVVDSGNVLNYVTCAMRLTRGRLQRQDDWEDWQNSEYLQLDQYDKQGMFGDPVAVESKEAVFHLVWSYAVKAADGRKKARMTCDGSPRSGQVRVLDHTYANCVDQTSSRMFYAISSAENLLIYGSDVSNAFGEAAPPKQGFFIRPDKAFHEWWVNHKGRTPIPPGHEKHADAILREIGLTPTTHEPCLYSGKVGGKRVIFKRQVDDFAAACPDQHTADLLFDMIDERLSIPLKRQGLIEMFNGMDVVQTRDYIKLHCKSYIERIFEKHLASWMKHVPISSDRPLPMKTEPNYLKRLLTAVGSTDPKEHAKLAKEFGFSFRSGIGEIIYPMSTCRPDLSFASIKLSQASACPHREHFKALQHTIRYLYATRDYGLYYWRPRPQLELPSAPLPAIHSNSQDLLPRGRPDHDPLYTHGFADSDWATCPRTRRSFGGACARLAGGTIAYKSRFQATVASSSTEAEFMAACDLGRMMLYIRSVLWDLDIPQETATLLYEDNDACTAMGNAQKPTTRTRHMDIKYFVLCEWIERDMLKLERVDTSLNMADHFTKPLPRALFYRHVDYILGNVPPAYAPAYDRAVGKFLSVTPPLTRLPTHFTTVGNFQPKFNPVAATAARVRGPVIGSHHASWARIVWSGLR